MQKVRLASKYVSYMLHAKTKHGVHSPFIFNLLTEAIAKKNKSIHLLEEIELLRDELKRNTASLKINDYGAGNNNGVTEKKMCDIASQSAKPEKYAALLYRLVNYFKPAVILELGTSLGISTMYLAAANPAAKIITIEGSGETANLAQQNFNRLGFSNIQVVTGRFDDVLPGVLQANNKIDFVFVDGNHRLEPTLAYFNQLLKVVHSKSVFVFDDINWSNEMNEAWQKIKSHAEITVSIDLFMMGIVFFDKNLSKEHFQLRF